MDKKTRQGFLDELERLVKASQAGDFRITLSESFSSSHDAKAAGLINKALGNYRKAIEYDLMKYKLTSDALSIALWDMDIVVEDPVSPNNKFTWSKEIRQMLGFKDESDFPNLLSSWSNRLHPDDKEQVLEAFAAHITDMSGTTPYDITYRLKTKNEEYRHFHAYGNTLRNPAGIPLRVAGALMDITERVDMAEALKEALVEAESANEAKSEFLANMSHEMRTPLNAIIGLTGLSLENDFLDDETQQHMEKVHNAGTTLLGIVNDILDISKIESGKFELVPVDYCVPSLINDTVTQNLLRIGEKSITMKLDVGTEMYARLYGDELRIKQIMNNLLSNAIKYTSEGEVELMLHCSHQDDVVRLVIKVRDTGHGIKADDLDKLFMDYSQLDMKANRKIEGTGLGLSITKRLCELMDGTITVESEYGKGSVFTVAVNQTLVSDALIGSEIIKNLNTFHYFDDRRAREKKLERISLPYAHVLVVDDNHTNLDVAKGLMKPYGMKIACVDSGQKAIDAIKALEGRFDAIFMDQMMPGMDGIEATQKIREIGTDYAKNIPVIALTANAIVGNEEMFLSKGFQAFLSKPIDISRLDSVIRQWIRDKDKEKQYAVEENDTVGYDQSDSETVSIFRGKGVAGLNINKGIKRFGGNERSYLEILRAYTANTKKILDTIDTVNEENIKSYEITIHGVKGSNYSICADRLGDLAKKLEHAAKAKDLYYIAEYNPPFLNVSRDFISNLEGFLATFETEEKKQSKDKPDREVLSRLYTACDSYDMDEVDAAMEEIAAYSYDSDEGLADWLQENVDLMNFSDIVIKLSEILDVSNTGEQI